MANQIPPDSWVQRTLSIGVPADVLLQAWCEPQVQRQLMAGWATLVAGGTERMTWSAHLPSDRRLQLESRRVEHVEGQRVRYQSEGEYGLHLQTDLSVQPAPADFGTEARLRVGYSLPGGALAESMVKWLGPTPELMVSTLLRRFKALLEAGEIPTLEHNPSAREESED